MAVNTLGFELSTRGECDIIDITGYVEEVLQESNINSGTATVFVPGSTASITTIEYESGAVNDFKAAIQRIAPTDIHYDHDARWGDGNGYSHVRAALLGPSLSVPFNSKRLLLGTWQQIVLVDFDNRPRNRRLVVQAVGD
ncbi:MAG: YjbQ family protein [Candidatus Dadabacteria bacterium]|nr:YjbQ family protein [Candidatus Dadabacteria bacterium]NIS09739.1 YjbQ family protein [Candidatus Dadabacteria bacterium]NIV41101.1 YjbQ family protein [Candidatus Dadabacteria bacterium]NIX16197.1 YjbQ family protein [Candidatus Dadabacteria bacterium]NIY22820.1 YjbQ family protein [Candidatus Dadabacteria bacterium]